MSKHTPGPWFWSEPEDMGYCDLKADAFVDEKYRAVIRYEMYEGSWPGSQDDAQDKANMILIAAAPDLLEALEAMIITYEYEASNENPSLLAARSAIAKAKGEAQ